MAGKSTLVNLMTGSFVAPAVIIHEYEIPTIFSRSAAGKIHNSNFKWLEFFITFLSFDRICLFGCLFGVFGRISRRLVGWWLSHYPETGLHMAEGRDF